MMTWALGLCLVPIMAMSVRILLTSHDRCWSVGSLPYVPALPSSDLRRSERLSSLASSSDHSLWNPTTHPLKLVLWIGGAKAPVDPRSKGPTSPSGVSRSLLSFLKAEPGQVFLMQLLLTLVHTSA